MRILHLISYSIYSGPMPGVLGLIETQLAAGHEVALAYDQVRGELDGYEEPLRPHHFPAGVEILADLKLSPKASLFEQLQDRKRLRYVVTHSKIDIIHCHLSHDHALATLSVKKLIPIVRTVHAARAFQRRFCWPLFQASALIARSETHRSLLKERCKKHMIPVFAAPGGVFLHSEVKSNFHLDAASFRFANKIPATAVLVFNCAHMKDRGQKELILAIAQITDVFLVLAGDGPDALLLKRQVFDLKLTERVFFTGYLPFPELSRIYQAADLVVVAQAGNDGSARAALEAIDFAIPLLVVSDGGSLDALALSLGASISVSHSKRPKDLCASLTTMLERLSFLKEAARKTRESHLDFLGFDRELILTHHAYQAAKAFFGDTP